MTKILLGIIAALLLSLVGLGLLLKTSYESNGQLETALTTANANYKECSNGREKDKTFKAKQGEILQDLFTSQDTLEEAYTSLLQEFEKGATACQPEKQNESVKADIPRVDFTIDRRVFDTAACAANNSCDKPPEGSPKRL